MKKPVSNLVRRKPVGKECILYVYVSFENFIYAKKIGKNNYKSVSSYINHLINLERERAKF